MNYVSFNYRDEVTYKNYDKLPDFKSLKQEIVSGIFKSVINNPTLSTTVRCKIRDEVVDKQFTISSQNDLNALSQYIKNSTLALKITESEAYDEEVSKKADPFLRTHLLTQEAPKFNSQLMQHVTIPDARDLVTGKIIGKITEVYASVNFTKTWRFKNEGNVNWPKEMKILFVSNLTGNAMGPNKERSLNFPDPIKIGEETNISVPLTAPTLVNEYTGFWRLAEVTDRIFGPRVRIQIDVKNRPSPEVLFSDDAEVSTKKGHLERLFPDLKESDFKEFKRWLFIGTLGNPADNEREKSGREALIDNTNIDDLLNDKKFNMEQIIRIVSWESSLRLRSLPWE